MQHDEQFLCDSFSISANLFNQIFFFFDFQPARVHHYMISLVKSILKNEHGFHNKQFLASFQAAARVLKVVAYIFWHVPLLLDSKFV